MSAEVLSFGQIRGQEQDIGIIRAGRRDRPHQAIHHNDDFPLELAQAAAFSGTHCSASRWAATPLASPACASINCQQMVFGNSAAVFWPSPRSRRDSLGTGHSGDRIFPSVPHQEIVSTVMLLGKLLECLDHIGSPHVSWNRSISVAKEAVCEGTSMGLKPSDCASLVVPDAATGSTAWNRLLAQSLQKRRCWQKKDKGPVFDQFPMKSMHSLTSHF